MNWLVVGDRLLKIRLFYILCICHILVANPESGPGFESSAVSDVFVCERVMDSPAVESEATSMLPEDCGRPSGS